MGDYAEEGNKSPKRTGLVMVVSECKRLHVASTKEWCQLDGALWDVKGLLQIFCLTYSYGSDKWSDTVSGPTGYRLYSMPLLRS